MRKAFDLPMEKVCRGRSTLASLPRSSPVHADSTSIAQSVICSLFAFREFRSNTLGRTAGRSRVDLSAAGTTTTSHFPCKN